MVKKKKSKVKSCFEFKIAKGRLPYIDYWYIYITYDSTNKKGNRFNLWLFDREIKGNKSQ